MKVLKRLSIVVYRNLPKRFTKYIVRLLSAKHTVGVVGVVWNEKGEVLLLHHTYDEPIRLPGGHMEYGEAPFATIRRELLEEANCSIEPLHILGIESLTRAKFDIFIHCKRIKELPFAVNEEVVAREWYTTDKLKEIDELPSLHYQYILKSQDILKSQAIAER
ncbi:NUDIX hydrolase [Fodinisporobacter ferrooxydans]|uniref:NUDIX hydrolase n=1 Tax=Fodinisporobacter ferrooxydans TaxID=2901836 RepID=A0ABY4CQB8_9BACL|nr:NUDIX hydrolase [Alicyclobacillaceae bacterium MYW30-H2]